MLNIFLCVYLGRFPWGRRMSKFCFLIICLILPFKKNLLIFQSEDTRHYKRQYHRGRCKSCFIEWTIFKILNVFSATHCHYIKLDYLRKESLNSDGHQFHQYQQNKQSSLILSELTEQVRKCGRVETDNGTQTLPSWYLDLQRQHYTDYTITSS